MTISHPVGDNSNVITGCIYSRTLLFLQCVQTDEGRGQVLAGLVPNRVVAIEFWHGFIDYNYVSLNRQLIPITITKVAYK